MAGETIVLPELEPSPLPLTVDEFKDLIPVLYTRYHGFVRSDRWGWLLDTLGFEKDPIKRHNLYTQLKAEKFFGKKFCV